MINIKGGLDRAQDYAAEHEAPDWESLIGNPTWRQRAAYYKKAIANGVTFIGSTNLLLFLPDSLKWIGVVVALVGWFVGVQVRNADAPPVKDPTGWVKNAAPPASAAVPPTVDQVTADDVDGDQQPAMSRLDADAQLEVEDRDAVPADEA